MRNLVVMIKYKGLIIQFTKSKKKKNNNNNFKNNGKDFTVCNIKIIEGFLLRYFIWSLPVVGPSVHQCTHFYL